MWYLCISSPSKWTLMCSLEAQVDAGLLYTEGQMQAVRIRAKPYKLSNERVDQR